MRAQKPFEVKITIKRKEDVMRCPTCGSYEHKTLEMKVSQFSESLVECVVCGSSWSVNHGLAEIVVDSQSASFLEGQSECVEADDYPWAVYSEPVFN